jgi:hypothetical protein
MQISITLFDRKLLKAFVFLSNIPEIPWSSNSKWIHSTQRLEFEQLRRNRMLKNANYIVAFVSYIAKTLFPSRMLLRAFDSSFYTTV